MDFQTFPANHHCCCARLPSILQPTYFVQNKILREIKGAHPFDQVCIFWAAGLHSCLYTLSVLIVWVLDCTVASSPPACSLFGCWTAQLPLHLERAHCLDAGLHSCLHTSSVIIVWVLDCIVPSFSRRLTMRAFCIKCTVRVACLYCHSTRKSGLPSLTSTALGSLGLLASLRTSKR